jgi:hypothetical protein
MADDSLDIQLKVIGDAYNQLKDWQRNGIKIPTKLDLNAPGLSTQEYNNRQVGQMNMQSAKFDTARRAAVDKELAKLFNDQAKAYKDQLARTIKDIKVGELNRGGDSIRQTLQQARDGIRKVLEGDIKNTLKQVEASRGSKESGFIQQSLSQVREGIRKTLESDIQATLKKVEASRGAKADGFIEQSLSQVKDVVRKSIEAEIKGNLKQVQTSQKVAGFSEQSLSEVKKGIQKTIEADIKETLKQVEASRGTKEGGYIEQSLSQVKEGIRKAAEADIKESLKKVEASRGTKQTGFVEQSLSQVRDGLRKVSEEDIKKNLKSTELSRGSKDAGFSEQSLSQAKAGIRKVLEDDIKNTLRKVESSRGTKETGFIEQSLSQVRSGIRKVVEGDIKKSLDAIELQRRNPGGGGGGGGGGPRGPSVSTSLDNVSGLLSKFNRAEFRKNYNLEEANLDFRKSNLLRNSDKVKEEIAFKRNLLPGDITSQRKFFDVAKLKDEGIAKELGFAALFGKGLVGKAAGVAGGGLGALVGGPAGAFVGSTIGQITSDLFTESLDKLQEKMKQATEAANEFERASLGIAASLGANTEVIKGGTKVDGVEAFKLNQKEARGLQDAVRRETSSIGLSSEIAGSLGTALTQGYAGTEGFGADFLGRASKRLGAFAVLGDKSITTNPTQFLRDITDITNQTSNAKNTQLGARISKVAPDIFTAKTAEQFDKATASLEKYVVALKNADDVLIQSIEIEGQRKNAEIEFGQGINDAVLPGLKNINTELDLGKDVFKEAARGLGSFLGGIENVGKNAEALGIRLTRQVLETGQTIGKGVKDVGSSGSNLLNVLTKGRFGTAFADQKDNDVERIPTFEKQLSGALGPYGFNAEKDLSAYNTSRSNRAQLAAFSNVFNQITGPDADSAFKGTFGDLGAGQKSNVVGVTGFGALKRLQARRAEEANFFNTGTIEGSRGALNNDSRNLSLQSNVAERLISSLRDTISTRDDDERRRLEAVRTNTLTGDEKSYSSEEKIADLDKLSEAEDRLKEIRVAQEKTTLSLAESEKSFREGLLGAIDTFTFAGQKRSFRQQQLNIEGDEADLSNLTGRDRELAKERLASKEGNLARAKELQPFEEAKSAASLSLGITQLGYIAKNNANDLIAFGDAVTQSTSALKEFNDSAKLRQLGKEDTYISALENYKSLGGSSLDLGVESPFGLSLEGSSAADIFGDSSSLKKSLAKEQLNQAARAINKRPEEDKIQGNALSKAVDDANQALKELPLKQAVASLDKLIEVITNAQKFNLTPGSRPRTLEEKAEADKLQKKFKLTKFTPGDLLGSLGGAASLGAGSFLSPENLSETEEPSYVTSEFGGNIKKPEDIIKRQEPQGILDPIFGEAVGGGKLSTKGGQAFEDIVGGLLDSDISKFDSTNAARNKKSNKVFRPSVVSADAPDVFAFDEKKRSQAPLTGGDLFKKQIVDVSSATAQDVGAAAAGAVKQGVDGGAQVVDAIKNLPAQIGLQMRFALDNSFSGQ